LEAGVPSCEGLYLFVAKRTLEAAFNFLKPKQGADCENRICENADTMQACAAFLKVQTNGLEKL